MRDHLKLHLVVLAWGFTAILGRLIDLPAVQLVVWRTLLAALGLYGVARMFRVSVRLPAAATAVLLGTGTLIGVHWILFFMAAKVSNATISVAGLPTTILWCSLLEAAFVPGKRLRWYEVVLGLMMVAAVWLILQFEFRYSFGLLLSLASAAVGSVFAVLNSRLVRHHHFSVISFYQMSGGCLVTLLAVPFMESWTAPGAADLGWLLILSLVCTVYAYTAYVELLRRLSVFTINLVYNLEPVYGILLAAMILHEHHSLSPQFYAGTGVIVLSVLAHPLIQRWERSSSAA